MNSDGDRMDLYTMFLAVMGVLIFLVLEVVK